MIKFSFIAIIVILCTSSSLITLNSDEERVQKAIISWADSIFYQYEEYRFEQFHAEYTDAYQIATLRLKMYQGKQDNLEKSKAKGFYKKTDAEYEKELHDLATKNNELKKIIENFKNKVEFYQILFWSNIKTNQGITVYYSHLVTLDNNYKVTSATIKSEIGKKNEKTKILYAKDVKNKN